uniref:cilia- and flagella-associated protein 74 n=1 Tax=Semicossyphus pulcher TaxID=241346 RepID=UPI0037E86F41
MDKLKWTFKKRKVHLKWHQTVLVCANEDRQDGPGQESLEDEEPALPPYMKWLEELYELDNVHGDDDILVVNDNSEKRINAETAQMFKLRRNLDQLDSFHQQKEQYVLKAREELKFCHQNIESLVEQRDSLESKIEQQKADDSVAVFRLRAQHKHLCQKLQSEEELEGHINSELKKLELELSEVEVELDRLSLLQKDLKEEEQIFQVLKAQRAATRFQREKKFCKNLQLKLQLLRDHAKEESTECQKKIEKGQASCKIAGKYLKETIKRMHQLETEKEQQIKKLLEKRRLAVKLLKSNIAAIQESLRVQQRRAQANAQRKEHQQRQLRKSLQAQGTNSIKHMYQQKQLEERKRKQEEFEERQKSERVEIVAKILQEEQLVKSRKKHQALLPKPSTYDKIPSRDGAREKLLYYLDLRSSSAPEERAIRLRDFSDISSSSSVSSDGEDLEETMQKEDHQSIADRLIELELSGLWYQNYKKLLNEKPTLVQTEVKQEQPAMASQKLNMPAKKVHGKQLRGTPFSSKPGIILFKDFEVGKIYKKKIVLTNISDITNHCKLLGVSAIMKDFISIKFDSSVLLSTGMSCDVQIIFQPMINEDLEGEVQFAYAVGHFSVSVRCTTKKCDLEVDEHCVDFGLHVVGQTISRYVTLTNKGALATLFSLDTSSCLSPATNYIPMLSQVSANTCQKTSSQNTTSDNQTSSASIGTGELHLMQESQRLSEKLQPRQPVPEASATDPQAVPMKSDSLVPGGEIGPFKSIKLEVLFTPTIPGEAKLDFHIKFSDLNSKPIPIQVRGVAVIVPVWLVRPSIDLKICMFDHIYQDSITVQSRASTALKLTFEVCPEMRKHMEILPKTCFIQAQSSFNALLKFLPRCSLTEDAQKFYDRDTGVLEVPMTVQVAGQVKPVHFTIQAVVTTSDLQFDRTEVDFGSCSIYQSVKSCIRLSNLSVLPQDFCFFGVPEGNIFVLKWQTPPLPRKDFPLSCQAVGFHPQLQLSHSLVPFEATAIGWHSTNVLCVINHKTNYNQSKQTISSTVKDAMAPVASRLFSFALPKDSDISINPSAGRLLLGEKCLIQVTFRPRLLDQEIQEEALRISRRAVLLHEKELEKNKHSKHSPHPDHTSPSCLSPNKGRPHVDKSEMYEKARASLLYSFVQRDREYTVPCFVLDGDHSVKDYEDQLAWSPLNTLYLKLQCPAVQPPLVVTSNNGSNIIDFHKVAVGEKVIKRFTVQNISKERRIDLGSSVLNIHGPFSLLNALRCIRPREKHTLVLAFSPFLEKRYCETLEVRSQKMTLEMTFCGEGVVPAVTCSQPGGLLDFGYVFQRESTSKVLKLQNSSMVAVVFRVHLASFFPFRPQGGADFVALQLGIYKDLQVQPNVGTQNYSGRSVFSVVPGEGSIAPGQSQDITVTFQPDHPSVNYSDRLTIELINMTKVCVMDLRGAASLHNMYLYGGDILTASSDDLLPSLISDQPQLKDSEVMEKSTVPVLVTLRACYCRGSITPAVRELQVGCVGSTQPSKKSGEFHWDNLASMQQQGFNVEPSKGTVEAGHRRTITVTWTPHSRYKPYHMVQACVSLTLKGDEINVYKVTLMASVSTTVD